MRSRDGGTFWVAGINQKRHNLSKVGKGARDKGKNKKLVRARCFFAPPWLSKKSLASQLSGTAAHMEVLRLQARTALGPADSSNSLALWAPHAAAAAAAALDEAAWASSRALDWRRSEAFWDALFPRFPPPFFPRFLPLLLLLALLRLTATLGSMPPLVKLPEAMLPDS